MGVGQCAPGSGGQADTAGGAAGGGRAGGGGGGGGSPGLDSEQLRTSLFWLEQHIRRNKLRAGLTLTDTLRQAAEEGERARELTSKKEAKRFAFYLFMNVLGCELKERK